MFKLIRLLFNTVINDTKAEYAFHIDKSKFTAEQSASFDRIVDFLANMVEKYSPEFDNIITDKTNANTVKQAV